MKKLIIILIIVSLIYSCSSKKEVLKVSCGHNKNVKLKNVDLDSFNCINSYYGKDKNSVYYLDIFPVKNKGYGKRIIGADPKTFDIDIFVRDKNSIYYAGKKIKGVDISTFRKLNVNYYRDKNNIYSRGKVIKGVDIKTFELLNDPQEEDSYFKDKNNIYFYGRKIKKSDPLTFEFLDDGYSMDKNNVYFRGNTYPRRSGRTRYKKADIKTFKVLKKNYAKDKNYVYFGYIVFKNSDPETFIVYETEKKLNNFNYEAEDKNNYYYHGRIMKKK